MKNFNADDYEPVEARVTRFYKDHPDGSIYTVLKSNPDNVDYAVFQAEIYIGKDLRATGWSQAIRDKELTKSKKGFDYESVNYTSWLENAETSAIGRGLANFGYQGSKRASREEMQKASAREQTGEDETEFKRDDALFLRDLLLSYLGKVEDTVGKDRADKLRAATVKNEASGQWRRFAEWITAAHEALKAEVEKQEALLAANTTKPANPPEKALGTLGDAVGAKAGEKATTQGGLPYDHE